MKRLLIVEDKESLALMLQETVAAEGLEADVAANGAEAINRLAAGRRYFAVLTDLRLPGLDAARHRRRAGTLGGGRSRRDDLAGHRPRGRRRADARHARFRGPFLADRRDAVPLGRSLTAKP